MGKHKKFLKSEKAKVKLKGNKLPKGQNVTKTDFRVKKIIIKDQSIQDFSDNLFEKHNLKEILMKLKHHNSSFRIDALKHLKDKITTKSDELKLLMGMTIQGLSAMCLDIERDVRRESFKVFTILFSTISREHIEPFFDVVLSYLSCAMTHIQQSIQDDSLFILDILLKYQPKLMAINSEKIFNNFLDMISKVSNSQNRSLVLSMGNKMSTVKWRGKIMLRIKEMLKTMMEINENKHTKSTIKREILKLNCIEPMHFSLYRSDVFFSCAVSNLLHKSVTEKGIKINNDDEKLKSYATQLVPLLFNSWLEVAPTDGQEVISTDSAFTLKTIIETFENLWKIFELQSRKTNIDDLLIWFRETYYEEFKNGIFIKFPYQQAEEMKDKKDVHSKRSKEISNSGGQYCLSQNLTIIYLYCVLASDQTQFDTESISKIFNFLQVTLRNVQRFTNEELNRMEETLKIILLHKSCYFIKSDKKECRNLFKTILNILNSKNTNNNFSGEFRNKILILVSDIILNDSLYETYASNEFQKWISKLPQMLCRPHITQNNILVLSKLAKQGNSVFLAALKNDIKNILNNLPQIHVLGLENSNEGKKSIINLFFWIKDLTKDEQQNICKEAETFLKNDYELINYFNFVIIKQNV